ncbi:MAG: glycosyltransferase [Ruminococcaceae bacterium]|nr:glycosyltransferase [Oscillospiraceae bacterium]
MNKEKKNDFLFSVVIPVYKVEDYVEETIQSVLQQTIGFEKHIQMILVNDGSPDNSGAVAAICAALDAECALQAPYTDRVAHFYAYHDNQNARRIYDAVRSDQAKK